MSLKRVKWQIGATSRLFARMHSGDGAGVATGLLDENGNSEGKYITAAQVDAIVCRVYENGVSVGTPSIAAGAVISAVTSGFSTDGAGRNADDGAYNFLYDLTTNLIASAGKNYRVTIDITLTTGTVLATAAWEGPAFDLSP